jgi:serine/threonine protein kinase
MRIFHVQPTGEFWIVIMEMLQGDDLTKNKLRSKQYMECFGQLADAVWAMGEKHIVHRDLKPSNIVLRTSDYSPAIIDFGIAVDLTALEFGFSGICGTPYFMSPEAFSEEKPNPAWDAYSLGITVATVSSKKPNLSSVKGMDELIQKKLSGAFAYEIQQALLNIESNEVRSGV